MKHVKLFEAWDQEMSGQTPAQLLVTGDWTGILTNPDKFARGFAGEFIAPMTYIFQYVPAGSPIPSGYEFINSEEPLDNMEDIAESVFGGDQSGAYTAPDKSVYTSEIETQFGQDRRDGIVRLFIDPSIDPADIETAMKDQCENIYNGEENWDSDSIDATEDPSLFEPAFLEAAQSGTPFPRRVIFK
jgi:hypothetical protein